MRAVFPDTDGDHRCASMSTVSGAFYPPSVLHDVNKAQHILCARGLRGNNHWLLFDFCGARRQWELQNKIKICKRAPDPTE